MIAWMADHSRGRRATPQEIANVVIDLGFNWGARHESVRFLNPAQHPVGGGFAAAGATADRDNRIPDAGAAARGDRSHRPQL
jgi:hypothetical protein